MGCASTVRYTARMVATLLCLFAAIWFVSLAVFVTAIRRAPVGVETVHGFHVVDELERHGPVLATAVSAS